ncbi:class I SAM-dependent methyltransferase [Parvibaculum sp.]|jgi:SAM-dependent methyltransferase|uniref:class I SAM-dependent methyltransferase n=1 Tax=Parvibaculum sp. TaxID=2024848 RepID=UPI002FD94CFD
MTEKSHDPDTLAFYDAEAEAYAARGDRTDASDPLRAFLARLAPGAHVLDLGSGDGRHSAAMIEAGFEVTPLDGSAGLAAIASRRLGKQVRIMRFEEIEDSAAFDAIWAHASLLHMPRDAVPGILARLHRALKPGGRLFASFKAGGSEGRDTLGRYYNYPSKEDLASWFAASAAWSGVEIEESKGGGYDRKPTDWLILQAVRPPSP